MVAKREHFRSGLEYRIAKDLDDKGITYEYETFKITYQKKVSSYLPDFRLPNGIIIEGKGRFLSSDRAKHLLIKEQHPELDIRFVFSNSRATLSKASTTSYGEWCDRHGFLYSNKLIPNEWINE